MTTTASTTPKFKVKDRVNKKINSGVYLYVGATAGTITEVKTKYNVRGRICYYYGVKWPDGRRSEHAQHILVPAP